MPNVDGLELTNKSALQSASQYQIQDFYEATGTSAREAETLIARHNYATLWTYAVNGILACWLIANPHIFDYQSKQLAISDTISGALIILFELIAFSPKLSFARFGTAAVAVWLLFAPLIFWSPTPAVFLTDTIVAIFLIAMSILIPGTPGSGGKSLDGPDMPMQWTYNPSSWIRRWAGIALALVGFFISRYLAAHQLGYVSHAWDPFFGDGSDKVTGSAISRAFPISDAGFGSVAYVIEVMTGFMGDRARWRTAPWIVVLFAMVVLPLGVTSIILVITQPIFVGSWCGLCLCAAVALMTSVPLSVHEAIAVGQFLVAAKKQNKNMWRIFWMGGTVIGSGKQDPDRMNFTLLQRCAASVQGVNLPLTLALQIVVGAWLMARPDVLPLSGNSANCDHLFGAIAVTMAMVSTAEVTRIVRFINIPVGALVLLSGVVFGHGSIPVMASDIIAGVLLILSSIPRGSIAERYGNWDRFVR
ncbi:MAG TPA: vitamin K epoxide reductase family protein [Drouetiella sp.]